MKQTKEKIGMANQSLKKLSDLLRLRSRIYPVSEIIVAKTPCSAMQELNHYTAAAPRDKMELVLVKELIQQNNELYRDNVNIGISTRLKVNGLSSNVQVPHLKEIFSQYGEIIGAEFPYRKKGLEESAWSIAYVEYTAKDAAVRAREGMDEGQ